MKQGSWLLGLCVALDLLGFLVATKLVLWPLDPGLVLGFLLLAWFLGAYAFLRWPWMSYRQLARRWLLVVGSALLIAALWFPPSAFLIAGLIFVVWGLVLRRWLQPIARHQATERLAASAVFRQRIQSNNTEAAGPSRQLLLLFVAYHPSAQEVAQLQTCLAELSPDVGYAVVVNDHHPGEPVERLAAAADCFLTNRDNPGYGRAVNRLVAQLEELPAYIGVLNTDLSWSAGTFERLLAWLHSHPQVNLAVPQILDEAGTPQKLCKNHPTVLGLFSRRFLPNWLKPAWLKRYDRWYVMADQDYNQVFEAPYLSGCCMLIKSDSFRQDGGFDERYFLYLEDADLTRSLARGGRCVHLPVAAVVHGWGRGNYRDFRLLLVNLVSAWQYFRKWGWALW